MKIKPEHYEKLEQAMKLIMEKHPAKEYRDAGHSEKSYRWDVLRATGLMRWVCDTLYPYANDDHIDTALRRITKASQRPPA